MSTTTFYITNESCSTWSFKAFKIKDHESEPEHHFSEWDIIWFRSIQAKVLFEIQKKKTNTDHNENVIVSYFIVLVHLALLTLNHRNY